MDIIRCPAGMESRREEFAAALARANGIVEAFAVAHPCLRTDAAPCYSSVEIFASQAALWERIKTLEGQDADAPVPDNGLSAALVNGVLLLLTPESYQSLQPHYASVPNAWERLVAHELVHELHLCLLDGEHDRMGPKWWYEGLAMVGAGLIAQPGGITSASDALALVKREGCGSYQRYGEAVAYFLQRTDLPSLAERASERGFEDWLRTLDGDSGNAST